MSNILVRGLPPSIHHQVQRFADSENLSVNQLLVRWITEAVEQKRGDGEKGKREQEVFQRLREIRQRFYQKYGKQEDSAKIIREFRDSR